MEPYVIKESGEREPFSEAKLRSALARAKVPAELADEAVSEVRHELHDGMKTNEIYRLAFSFLAGRERVYAQRYGLRRAIMDLGPDGHSFEVFVGEILESQGYSVKTGQIVEGACVSHEVDVVAENAAERVLVECKFHNDQQIKSDIKVALYVQARFDDIKKRAAREGVNAFHATWLVTNTKLSGDAIRYTKCVGMKAIGWGYPVEEGNLQQLIEDAGLHPITSLTGLGEHEKRTLLEAGIVTCHRMKKEAARLPSLGLSEDRVHALLDEASKLCEGKV